MRDANVFAGAILSRGTPFCDRLRIMTDAGQTKVGDAYRFPPTLSQIDTRLLAEETHLRR
jgi:hypothetical protein